MATDGKVFTLFIVGLCVGVGASGQSLPNLFPLPDGSGFVETYDVNNSSISLSGAFFNR